MRLGVAISKGAPSEVAGRQNAARVRDFGADRDMIYVNKFLEGDILGNRFGSMVLKISSHDRGLFGFVYRDLRQ